MELEDDDGDLRKVMIELEVYGNLIKHYVAQLSELKTIIFNNNNILQIELPWRWTAPEAIEHQQFTHNSDVWAFGITLWEMFTFCQTPYQSLSNTQVVEQIKIGLRLPQPNYSETDPKLLKVFFLNIRYLIFTIIFTSIEIIFPCAFQGIYNLMLECWNENPRERPSFETLQSDLDEFGPT